MDLLSKYFPDLTVEQTGRFALMEECYKDWNTRINVVSRKDVDELYLRHVLHSLGIAKVQSFKPGSKIIDVGTGGGFPEIPLAVLFPEVNFHLVDSIGKKIKVVEEVAAALELDNVQVTNARVESLQGSYDFVISRAVAQMSTFVRWVRHLVAPESHHQLANGILYLKGGDLSEELRPFPKSNIYRLSEYFQEDFFETKYVVHLPL